MPEVQTTKAREELLTALRGMIGKDGYRAMASVVFYSDESMNLVTHGCSNLSLEHGLLLFSIEIFQKCCNEIHAAMMISQNGPSN